MPRKTDRRRTPAQSLYGQIRLTVTFEPGGQASYRALAKRPQDDWKELHVFASGGEHFGAYPPDFHTALQCFALVAEGLRWMPGEGPRQ